MVDTPDTSDVARDGGFRAGKGDPAGGEGTNAAPPTVGAEAQFRLP